MPYSIQQGNDMQSFQSGDSLSENATDHSMDTANSPQPKLLVEYKGETFDIQDFLVEHPGGRTILEKYENKDITRAFDDINHSEYARKKMKQYLLSDKTIHIAPISIKGNKVDAKFVVRKLFTKEDQNNIHKVLGFLSLCSYVYRYFWVYPTTGSLGFVGTKFDWFTLLLHFMLSFSSLIFHVVERRIVSNPLIIYQEYRMHAIVFTFRAIIITVFGLYQHLLSTAQARLALSLLMISIHATVDYITVLYGTPGITTVRNDDNGTIPYVKLFFAFYQVLAMSSHVVTDPDLKNLGWNTAVAIQSSGKTFFSLLF
jgi:cytochrome b involved in lipid metabolism